MLCDDLVQAVDDKATTERLRDYFGDNPMHYAKMVDHRAMVSRRIRTAQRFVLSPLVVETVNQLSCDPEAIERSRDALFWPAELTWVEWHGETSWFPGEQRMGMIFGGVRPADSDKPEVHVGELIFWLMPSTAAHTIWPRTPAYFSCDLPGGEVFTEEDQDWNKGQARLGNKGKGETPILTLAQKSLTPGNLLKDDLDLTRMGAWVGSMLALMNTPRLSHVVTHDHSKLNAARIRRGKPPVLSWSEVVITVDRGELGLGEQLTRTGQRAFHHVRTHLRVKRGRVELVRPHWRGNREVGIKHHRHLVTRAEDEPGSWKGGDLPAPRLIKSHLGDDT